MKEQGAEAPPVSLRDISLRRSLLEVSADDGAEGGQLDVNVNVKIRASDEPTAEGVGVFIITGMDPDGETRVFQIEMKFRAVYDFHPDKWGKRERLRFLRRNILSHVWPYAREHAHQLSVKAGLPPVILPLVPLARPEEAVVTESVDEDE